MANPKVVVAREMPALEPLKAAAEVVVGGDGWTRADLLAAVREADGFLAAGHAPLNREFFDAAPKLRVLASISVGLDHVDIPEATRRGIWVSNTAGTLTAAVAEYTWGLLLAATHRISEGERLLRAGKWPGVSPMFFLGREVHGKTLGVVGAGRIGRAILDKAPAFGMKAVYWSRTPHDGLDGWRPLDDLLRESDIVVLAVALTSETTRLVDARAIGLMKPTAYLVNVARGAVVDEAALAKALLEKRIAGAALDVYEREPEVHPDLLRCENAVLAPHLGSATIETRTLMAATAVENLLAGLRGERPPLAVNEPKPRA